MTRRNPIRVAVAGATGLVGRALLARLRIDPAVGRIYALVRAAGRPSALPDGVEPIAIDYARLGSADGVALPALDRAVCALGTTIKVAGSQAAFRAVDVDAVVAFARAAKAAGAQRLGVVSALGADAKSAVFYSRCKGEMEAALRGLGFGALVIARPALLQGDREALGQPARPGEVWAQRLSPVLSRLLPQRWRPIAADTVAAALLAALDAAPAGVTVLESDRLQQLGRKH